MDRKIKQLEIQLIDYEELMLKDDITREEVRQQNIVDFAKRIDRAKAEIREMEGEIYKDGCWLKRFPLEVELAWEKTEAALHRLMYRLEFDFDSDFEDQSQSSWETSEQGENE